MLAQVIREQVELLVEHRLRHDIKGYLRVLDKRALVRHLDGPPVRQSAARELEAVPFEGYQRPVIGHPYRVRRQIVHNTLSSVSATFCQSAGRSVSVSGLCSVRRSRSNDVCFLQTSFAQLVLYIELADTLYLIAEEIQTERYVVTVTVDIDNRTAHGILAGLEHKVHALKAQVRELCSQFRLLNLLSDGQLKTDRRESFFRRHFFCHRLRISHHDEPVLRPFTR